MRAFGVFLLSVIVVNAAEWRSKSQFIQISSIILFFFVFLLF